MKMWRCKHCGGTEFIERVVGGYEKYGGYAKDGYPLGLEKSDYETNVECEKCGNYGDDIKSGRITIMENKIDNVNKPSHYQLECGVESIEIIKRVLGLKGFVAFCLGNVLKYLIRAEKKNGKEDYKKAAKYLEWVIENYYIEDEFVEYGIYAIEEEFNIKWNEIISEIAKDLKIKEAFKLDAIFRDVLSENYETAKKILDNFIKEYEVA